GNKDVADDFWAKPYIEQLEKQNIMNGDTDNNFRPNDKITREEITKVVNLASNLAALFVFIINGKVWYAIGIPAAICGMAGNYLGASLAIKNGAKFIKPVIVLVIVVLFGKIIMDFVG
ncbi:MAG: S-layer homology domain-containing protein, partial [Clostridium sp.]